MIAPCRA